MIRAYGTIVHTLEESKFLAHKFSASDNALRILENNEYKIPYIFYYPSNSSSKMFGWDRKDVTACLYNSSEYKHVQLHINLKVGGVLLD